MSVDSPRCDTVVIIQIRKGEEVQEKNAQKHYCPVIVVVVMDRTRTRAHRKDRLDTKRFETFKLCAKRNANGVHDSIHHIILLIMLHKNVPKYCITITFGMTGVCL